MWNKIIFDQSIILYIVAAGGLTELFMRATSNVEAITRRRFAAISTFVVAIGVAMIDGLRQQILWSNSLFKGIIAAALTAALYDYIKSMLVGFVKKSQDDPGEPNAGDIR